MKVYRSLFLFLLLPIMYGCPPDCHNYLATNDYFFVSTPLPDSVLNIIPYKDSATYTFQHSNGHLLTFKSVRENELQYNTAECGNITENSYYINTTRLSCEYPSINIDMFLYQLRNGNVEFDFFINQSQFYVTGEGVELNLPKTDSVLIGNRYYKNVYSIQNKAFSDGDSFADSIYYNTTEGILKIFVRNGESYIIHN